MQALTMKLPSWQVRTTLLIATLGPPVASLIVMTATYLPYCAALNEPVDVPGFVVAFIFFALPVGYAFGVVPALLAGALYCGALTAMATLRPGMLLRACLGAISGGLVGGVWFHAVVGPNSHGYGSVAALVVVLLSLRQPPALFLYFPARSQTQPKLRAFIEAAGNLTKRRPRGAGATAR
jgi:hypothetical protein